MALFSLRSKLIQLVRHQAHYKIAETKYWPMIPSVAKWWTEHTSLQCLSEVTEKPLNKLKNV